MTATLVHQKSISENALSEFKTGFKGEILLPNDSGYEAARKVWNGMIDRKPAIIARCSDVDDVVKSVNFARNQGLLVALRGGGHNVAGFGTCDGGIVIDLSKMKKIEVNDVSKTARAEPGLTWGEFDNATLAHGLGVTGGLVSSTGIAGFTLGGGVGWLVRKLGLTIDNLVSVDLVTADGKTVKASSEQNPELFWGMRGAGPNFGVVTSFEYKLDPIPPNILGGMVLYPLEMGSKVLEAHRRFTQNIPDELTTIAILLTAPPAPFIPAIFHGKKAVAIAACYSGKDPEEGKKILEPLRHLGEPVLDAFHAMPYVALQSMFDESAPRGVLNYWKSTFLPPMSESAIKTLLDCFESVPSPMTAVHLHHLGGAVNRVGEDATAYSHRDASFIMNLVSTWTDPAHSEKNIVWTRDTFTAMQKFAGEGGVYVNFLGEEGNDRIVSAYGEAKYARLLRLKSNYDPGNLFRVNQNIKPQNFA